MSFEASLGKKPSTRPVLGYSIRPCVNKTKHTKNDVCVCVQKEKSLCVCVQGGVVVISCVTCLEKEV